MQIICLENTAFYNLIETVVSRVKEQKQRKEDKWISADEAMHLLRIKSRTTLQKLRDDGQIRVSQPAKRIVLYDRDSILDCLEDFAYETFEMPE